MATEKPSGMVKFQFLLFGVLLFALLIWGSGKCSRTMEEREIEQMQEAIRQLREDSAATATAPTSPSPANPLTIAPTRPNSVQRDTVAGGQLQVIRERIRPLYITIEGLALRSGPGLNYEVVDRLPLLSEVNFLNEVTDSLYTLKLGTITTTKPWVKIRSHKGRDGWVYGAGVDFYKYELKGVN